MSNVDLNKKVFDLIDQSVIAYLNDDASKSIKLWEAHVDLLDSYGFSDQSFDDYLLCLIDKEWYINLN